MDKSIEGYGEAANLSAASFYVLSADAVDADTVHV